jgi:photosynthetic reaction center H subunit
MIGAFTRYIDVAQVVLYVFWAFFAALVFYLHRENKREGYPLESATNRGSIKIQGFPAVPTEPKVFLARNGGANDQNPSLQPAPYELRASWSSPAEGSPLQPTGDPMLDAVGPASYAQRKDVPDTTAEGTLRIVPLRVATDHHVAAEDADPRGYLVVGCDGEVAGTLLDLWVDRAEPQIRYLELTLTGGARRVLVPGTMVTYDSSLKRVNVASIPAARFATVPGLRNPDSVTLLEEDKIQGYYAGGHLYGTPSRFGPLI